MKQKTSNEIPFVINQLVKIMNDRKLTKIAFAELVDFPEAKWNKISNGQQNLSVTELSNIAEKLRLREIDIYTYPKTLIETDIVSGDLKTQITIELRENLKQKVLEMIFGNKNVQLLNK